MLEINLNGRILKYLVILALSVLLTTNIIGIFIPFDTTKIMVNYIAAEESGTIQLFYKQNEQDFSEEKSIVRKISESGHIFFVIPNSQIKEFRIDTDGISIFRIKNIEISKVGYNLIIDSGNWSNYYRMQYDMESIFDDGSLISYEAVGADPYIIFGVDDHSGSLEAYAGYYLLLLMGGGVSFSVICLVYKYVEKKGGSIKENIYVCVRYICVSLVLIHVVHSDMDIIKNISQREQTEYMVYIRGAEPVQLSEDLACSFIVHGKELLTQQFMIAPLESESGNVKYQITDQNGIVVTDAVESLQSVRRKFNREWDSIVINCENLGLEFGQEYEIRIQVESDIPISFIMNGSGEIQQRQTMRFAYEDLYIFIVIIISVAWLLLIFWIFQRGFQPKVFFVSSVALGVVACFVLAPCTADDEYRHFLRVYDIVSADTTAYRSYDFSEARGNVIVESQQGAPLLEVPYELNGLRMVDVSANYDNISYDAEMNYQACPDEVIRLFFKSESDENSVVAITATSSVSIWAYLPQVITAFVGKFLGMNAVGVFYMARIGNMLFAVVIAYLCMLLLPEHRNIFLLLHFAPNAFWISVSCNRDSVVTSLAMLCVVYIIYIKEKKKVMNIKRIIFLLVLFGILAIIKLPYILIAAMLLLLGSQNYPYIREEWRRRIAEVGIAVIILGISVGTYKLNSNLGAYWKVLTGHAQMESVEVEGGETAIEAKATHLSYVLEHPQEIAVILLDRYKTIFSEDLYRAVAGYRYHIGKYYFLIGFIILVFSKKVLKVWQRVYLMMVYMAIWFSIIVVGYTFMPPDYGSIWGINPRYMIPILPLLAVAVCSGNEGTERIVRETAPIVVFGMVVINIISMVVVYY